MLNSIYEKFKNEEKLIKDAMKCICKKENLNPINLFDKYIKINERKPTGEGLRVYRINNKNNEKYIFDEGYAVCKDVKNYCLDFFNPIYKKEMPLNDETKYKFMFCFIHVLYMQLLQDIYFKSFEPYYNLKISPEFKLVLQDVLNDYRYIGNRKHLCVLPCLYHMKNINFNNFKKINDCFVECFLEYMEISICFEYDREPTEEEAFELNKRYIDNKIYEIKYNISCLKDFETTKEKEYINKQLANLLGEFK